MESYLGISGDPMRFTPQMSITLPTGMAKAIRAKVASGEYASESEVIRDGLRALVARDRAMGSWLRNQVAPAFDRLNADPSRGRSVEQVRARLTKEHKRARSKK